ncbi:hypothetical protein [Lysobacter enzymogenes]|uniref:hypothetical protein n=1 Tax=Lysobacter enzymogenes TaxID=69 RepID=UPI001A96AAEA|nr:hypothetical protein [Lysobacter enzymogenes]QQP96166.1 hypothetical protein JHW38_23660 [Lysobacter enzymogenes]
MVRTILAVVAGMVLAMLTMHLFEYGSARLHPLPPGIDPRDPAAMSAHVAGAPWPAMLTVLAGWVAAAFDGGLLAALISRRHPRGAALTVGALIVCGVIAVSLLLPHAWWMIAAGVLSPLPASWLGARLAQRRARTAA